jgi:hypothetical protein
MRSVAQFAPGMSPFVLPEFQLGAFRIEPSIIGGDFQHGKVRPMQSAEVYGHSIECRRISLVQPLTFGEKLDALRAIHNEQILPESCLGRCPILLTSDPMRC